ncbi:MAG: hypothetical protein ACREMP_03000 [Candidatus Tyrphobacter sp.]
MTVVEARLDGIDKQLGEIKADVRSLRASQEEGFRRVWEVQEAGFRGAAQSLEALRAELGGRIDQSRSGHLAVTDALRAELGGRIDRVLYLVLGSWVTTMLAIFFHK